MTKFDKLYEKYDTMLNEGKRVYRINGEVFITSLSADGARKAYNKKHPDKVINTAKDADEFISFGDHISGLDYKTLTIDEYRDAAKAKGIRQGKS